MKKFTRTPLFALAVSASLVYAVPGIAGDHSDVHVTTTQEMKESTEAERAEMAAEVLKASLTGEDQSIPKALLEEAHAVVVVPHVVKGAFLVGGQYGKGLVSWRDADGNWSAPAFVSMGGASYGFQAGVKAVDLVLVVTDPNGLQALMDDELKLGAGIGVTAGPIGRDAEASTNLTLDTGIYSYSRSKGLFAGASRPGNSVGRLVFAAVLVRLLELDAVRRRFRRLGHLMRQVRHLEYDIGTIVIVARRGVDLVFVVDLERRDGKRLDSLRVGILCRFAVPNLLVAAFAAPASTSSAPPAPSATIGRGIVLGSLFSGCAALLGRFLVKERLAVRNRYLVVIGVNFGKSQETMPIAAVVDKGCLERRLYPRDFRKVDISA